MAYETPAPAAAPTAPTTPTRQPAKARYAALETERMPFLKRAREIAELTIPALMPPAGHSGSTQLATPWQSVGGDGVNSLASKLLLALLPPGSSFFRLTMDDFVVAKLEQSAGGGQAGTDARGKFEAALGKIERAVMNRLEQTGARISFFEALKQLIACGNCLLQIMERGHMRLHYLDHYVVKRAPSGTVLEIIVWEQVAKEALPPEARTLYDAEIVGKPQGDDQRKPADIYTCIYLEDDQYKVHQEICDKIIPGTDGNYPKDKSAWVPLRYTRIDGEDYGRGRGEEYLGDLRSMESLSQSLVEGTAIGAKVLFLMNQAAVTSRRDVERAPNGAIIEGDIRDIGILKLEKLADFTVAANLINKLEERLQKAFLINQTRDAERVTAEEIRLTAAELEKALGGVYSILSQELQLPVVARVMAVMTRANELPSLPAKTVAPQVVTGLEALGRGSDLQKLDTFIQGVSAEFGPEAVQEYVNVGAYMKRRATAMQIDLDGLLRSEEEVQQNRAQKAQAQMIEKLGPTAITATAKNAQPQGQQMMQQQQTK